MSAAGKTVLVTGGNGYLGSAVVLHFLQHGYKVHATVRSLAKAEGLKAYCLPKYESALSLFVVEDMTKDGAYEQSGALRGVDAICHVASPVPDISGAAPAPGQADWQRDTVRPAIDGTLTLLRAASGSSQVRHVNLISSGAAVFSFDVFASGKSNDVPLTEADWNDQTADDPTIGDNAFKAYFASKANAERQAWDYVKKNQPSWTFATFCPPMFLGPAGLRPKSRAELGTSLGLFYKAMLGEELAFPMDSSFIDVRDISLACRLAIEKLKPQQHERFLLSAGYQTTDEVVTFAKTGDAAVLQERPTNYNTTKVRELLGWQPHTKQQTFVDMRAYLKEAEKSLVK